MLIDINGIQYDVMWRHVTAERLKKRENRVRRFMAEGKIAEADARVAIQHVYDDATRLALGRLGLCAEVRGYTVVDIFTTDGATFQGQAACSIAEPSFNMEKGLTRALHRALDAAGITGAARARFRSAVEAARAAKRPRVDSY